MPPNRLKRSLRALHAKEPYPCPFCGQSQNSSDLETIMRAKDLYRRFRKYHPDSLDVLEEMIKDGELSQPREPNL